MAFAAGQTQKVSFGTVAVIGMGNWKMTGVTVDLLESTSFGDTAKQYMTGLVDYGSVTFGGLFDVSNAAANGQSLLISALANNSKIGSSLRFWVNATSYWAADDVTVSAAGVYITAVSIGADKSGLATVEFTGKFTGPVRQY